MTVYIVHDSNGYVQAFLNKASARADVIDGLKSHAVDYNYSDEELLEAIHELDEDFEAGRINCGTYLGEYEIICSESTVIED